MSNIQKSKISQAQLAVDNVLLANSLEEWEREKQTSFERIKLFGTTDSLAAIQIISSLPVGERNRLIAILPKRSRPFLQEATTNCFSIDENSAVKKFVNAMSHLIVPLADKKITEAFDHHMQNKLDKTLSKKVAQIKDALVDYLKDRHKEWDGYVFSKPERNLIRFERESKNCRIIADWDFRPWEFYCGLKSFESDGKILTHNETFLGGLGISASPSWYIDKKTAVNAIVVCENHALKISRLIDSVLNRVNK